MGFRSLIILAAITTLISPGVTEAKPKKKWSPPPAPAPLPPVPTVDLAQPSAQLQAYCGYNLEHLLGPLNNGAMPRAELLNLETAYRGQLPTASPAQKAVLNAAIKVCEAFTLIMNEREKAVMALDGGKASTSGSLGATRTAHLYDFRDELQAEREAGEQRARQRQATKDSGFIATAASNSVNTRWEAHRQEWRQAVVQLLTRERQAEAAATAAAPAS